MADANPERGSQGHNWVLLRPEVVRLREKIYWCAKCGLEWPAPSTSCARCEADAQTWREIRSVYPWTLWVDQFTTIDPKEPHRSGIFVTRLLEIIVLIILSVVAMVVGITLARPVSFDFAYGIAILFFVVVLLCLSLAQKLGSSSPLTDKVMKRIDHRNKNEPDADS